MLKRVVPNSNTDPPGYCKLAPQMDQSDASIRVKQTSTFTCLPSRQARSARTSMPLDVCTEFTGADSIVGYDGSIYAVGPAGTAGGTDDKLQAESSRQTRIRYCFMGS